MAATNVTSVNGAFQGLLPENVGQIREHYVHLTVVTADNLFPNGTIELQYPADNYTLSIQAGNGAYITAAGNVITLQTPIWGANGETPPAAFFTADFIVRVEATTGFTQPANIDVDYVASGYAATQTAVLDIDTPANVTWVEQKVDNVLVTGSIDSDSGATTGVSVVFVMNTFSGTTPVLPLAFILPNVFGATITSLTTGVTVSWNVSTGDGHILIDPATASITEISGLFYLDVSLEVTRNTVAASTLGSAFANASLASSFITFPAPGMYMPLASNIAGPAGSGTATYSSSYTIDASALQVEIAYTQVSVTPAAAADRYVYPYARSTAEIALSSGEQRNVDIEFSLSNVDIATGGILFVDVAASTVAPPACPETAVAVRAFSDSTVLTSPIPLGGAAHPARIFIPISDRSDGGSSNTLFTLRLEPYFALSALSSTDVFPTQVDLLIQRIEWRPPTYGAAPTVLVPLNPGDDTVSLGTGGASTVARAILESATSLAPTGADIALGSAFHIALQYLVPPHGASTSLIPRGYTSTVTISPALGTGGGISLADTGTASDGTFALVGSTYTWTGEVYRSGILRMVAIAELANANATMAPYGTAAITDVGTGTALDVVSLASIGPTMTPLALGLVSASPAAPRILPALVPNQPQPVVGSSDNAVAITVTLQAYTEYAAFTPSTSPAILFSLQFYAVDRPPEFQWTAAPTLDDVTVAVTSSMVPGEPVTVRAPFTLSAPLTRSVPVYVTLNSPVMNLTLVNGALINGIPTTDFQKNLPSIRQLGGAGMTGDLEGGRLSAHSAAVLLYRQGASMGQIELAADAVAAARGLSIVDAAVLTQRTAETETTPEAVPYTPLQFL